VGMTYSSRTPDSTMHLILDHVLQLLVINWARDDVAFQRLTGLTTSEIILSRIIVTMVDEDLSHHLRVASTKRRSILKRSSQNTSLAGHKFNHFTNCHTGWETVGIHDNVRADAGIVERHVLLVDDDTANTLLSVTRR